MKPSAQFAVAAVLSLVGAVVSVEVSLIGMVAVVVLVVVVGLRMQPRFAALSGGLFGVGATWLALNLNSLRICAGTADFCGNADYVPWLAASAVITLAGVALGTWTVLRSRRTPVR